MKALPISPGIAYGPAWIYRAASVNIEHYTVENVVAEQARLEDAIQRTQTQLARLFATASESLSAQDAAIFESHQMFLEDVEFIGAMRDMIHEQHVNAEFAAHEATERYAEMLTGLDDAYFQGRAQDVRDVGSRLVRALLRIDDAQANSPTTKSIVIAEDLTPSDTMQFDRANVLALVVMKGTPTSHVAILARGLGVPAVIAPDLNLSASLSERMAIVDGDAGEITFDPDIEAVEIAQQKREIWLAARYAARSVAMQPALTKDGEHIEVVANIGSEEDAISAIDYGAEGVGLFRTEFVFIDRDTLPNEEEQVAIYGKIARVMNTRPVVARTVDIGGDKPASYLSIVDEENPFLGWRGVRMISERSDILLTQLRALMRAFVNYNLRIMVPMISGIQEVRQVCALFDQARDELRREQLPFNENVQFGIMIEVPSAALIATHLAPLVDFFSIGTNDLTQYTLAVDRTNARVASLASPFHPAVLRLIQMTIQAAHAHNKHVAMCGEMAGDPIAAPLLLGLGLDEFSANASAIPLLKETLRKCNRAICKHIAERALSLDSADDVIAWLKQSAPSDG